MEQITFSLQEKFRRLETQILKKAPLLVAFSGGVDSSFLLAVTAKVLQKKVIALMTISAATPPEDERQAVLLAEKLHVQLIKIQHDELSIPQYAANPKNRCYFCKDSLYSICLYEAQRRSLRYIADGVNIDDLADFRPGLQAAEERSIIHPLVDAGFTKLDIRQGSKFMGLSTWDRPASPCLSSRIPYGNTITAAMLSQIAQGESFLRSLGFKEVRVRHHGKIARIEITKGDLQNIAFPARIRSIGRKLKELGFAQVLLDIEGYRTGVFNENSKSNTTIRSTF